MKPFKVSFRVLATLFVLVAGLVSSSVAQDTYISKSDGLWSAGSTWEGGVSPGTHINNYSTVLVRHNVTLANNLLIRKGEVKIEAAGRLTLDNADLATKPNGRFNIVGGKAYLINGSEILNEGKNNFGGVHLTNAYLEVDGSYLNSTGGEMYFDSSCVRVVSGNFTNQSGCIIYGDGNIDVVVGTLANYGTWSTNVDYCADPPLLGTFPMPPSCESAGLACNCLETACNPDIIQATFSSGKITGPGAFALGTGTVNENLIDDLYILGPDGETVLIDIVWKDGAYSQMVNVLAAYGISPTDFIYNGENSTYAPSRYITLFFPIDLITTLDDDTNAQLYILEVRHTQLSPTNACNYITGSGLNNQGDFAQETYLLRLGYGLSGEGLNIGIMSDSYNKLGGEASEVASCYLPGPGNTVNETPVNVIRDLNPALPYGQDEGMAMAEIVHSVAPKANLSFHTAFEGAGAHAEAIRTMALAGVNVITDDITHPTEPFFGPGLVSTAADQVSISDGVRFLTSAGNFGIRAFVAEYNAAANGCHQWTASGDTLLEVQLAAGDYLMVWQWEESFYSINGVGAQTDIDIHFANASGQSTHIFQDNNLGKDPVEMVPFHVNNSTTTYFKLKQVAGAGAGKIKCIVFKAPGTNGSGFQPMELISEWTKGTMSGHAQHSQYGFTLGAVRFSNTSWYGGSPVVEDFSSRGDSESNGKVGPDACAVQGANVGFDFGIQGFPDNDGLWNFFGTSASSPHAAALAALLMEADSKFSIGYDVFDVMRNNATPMSGGVNAVGTGFLTGYNTLRAFANPAPIIDSFSLDGTVDYAIDGGTLVINGQFFADPSEIEVYIRGVQYTPDPTLSDENTIVVDIDPYDFGNPIVYVVNLANTGSGLDGGTDSLDLLNVPLRSVTVKANDVSRDYAENNPALTFRAFYLDEGDTVDIPQTAYDILLASGAVTLTTSATPLTSASANPQIGVSIDDSLLPTEITEVYQLVAAPGVVTINPLQVVIQTKDTIVEYGAALLDVVRNYEVTLGDAESDISTSTEATVIANILDEYMAVQNSTDPAFANYLGVITGYGTSAFGTYADFVSGTSLGPLTLSNTDIGGIACVTSSGALGPLTLSNTLGGTSLGPLTLSNSLTIETEVLPVDAQLFWDADGSSGVDLSTGPNSAWGGTTSGEFTLANANSDFSLGPLTLSNTQTVIASALAGGSLGPLTLSNTGFQGGLGALTLSNGVGYSLGPLTLSNDIGTSLGALTLSNSNTVAMFYEGDVGSDSIRLVPINLITNISPGIQYGIPAVYLSNNPQNYDVKYNYGEITILPAPLLVKMLSDTINFGAITNVNSTAEIIGGELKYNDQLIGNVFDSIRIVDSEGNPWDGSPGVYIVEPVFTEWENYDVSVTPGTLLVQTVDITINALNDTVFTCNPVIDPNSYEVLPAGTDLGAVFPSGAAAVSAISLIESPPKGVYIDKIVVNLSEAPNPGYNVVIGDAADLHVVTPSTEEEESGCSTGLGSGQTGNPLQGDLSNGGFTNADVPLDVEVRAFPNPFSGELTIEVKNFSGSADLQLLNMVGQVVETTRIDLSDYGKITMELSDLTSGVYFVRLMGDRVDQTLKLIKQ